MTLRFWCARCGRSSEVPRALAGRRVRCRGCGHVQPIPGPAGPPATAEPGTYAMAPAPIPAPSPPPAADDRRPRRRSSPWREDLGGIVVEAGRLQGLSLVLLTLSLADLFMTFALLRTSPRFYESNPVAFWVFRRWNVAGMGVFKLGAVSLAIVLGEVIERRRPGWGRAVLVIGCAATTAVVWHGLRLYLGDGPMPIAGGD